MISQKPIQTARDTVRAAIIDTVTELVPAGETAVYSYTDPENNRGMNWVFGSNKEGDVEYIFRSPERGSEKTYVYSSSYGWSFEVENVNELLHEAGLIRRALVTAVESGDLSQSQLDSYTSKIEDAHGFQQEYSLSDVLSLLPGAEWTENGPNEEAELLQSLLVVDGDNDFSRYWTLLFTKQETATGEKTVKNDYTIPYHGEHLALVRAVREFTDDTQVVGILLGEDDTAEKFFMHRLSSTQKLDDKNYNWTQDDIRSELGFVHDMEHDTLDSIPFDSPIRVQGDLTMTRHNLKEIKSNYADDVFETMVWEEFFESNCEIGQKYAEETDQLTWGQAIPQNKPLCLAQGCDTEKLKQLQEKFNIPEAHIRDKQQEQGWKRLTAERRGNLVVETLHNRILQKAENKGYLNLTRIRESAARTARDVLDCDQQINRSVGNHSISVAPADSVATTILASIEDDIDGEAVLSVEDGATLMLSHNEHENKLHKLPEGAYSFGFLDGFLTLEERNLPPSVISQIVN